LGDAEEKFKELASAYGLVGDAEKRKDSIVVRLTRRAPSGLLGRTTTRITYPRNRIILMPTIPVSRISWIRKTPSLNY
jgi:hypothetical protein